MWPFGRGAEPRDRLPATFELSDIAGVTVPLQAGQVFPSFDIGRGRVDLGGAWQGRREPRPAAGFRVRRTPEVLARLQAEGGVTRPPAGEGWGPRTLPFPENALPEPEHDANPERFEGVAWYARSFDLDPGDADRACRLVFLSVATVADVWLNGRYLGWHEGGYTPFVFLLEPGQVRLKGNDLRVRVGNPPWGSEADGMPAVVTDWCNYAGILQDVYLEVLPEARLDRLDAVPAAGALEPVAVLAGARPGDRVRFAMRELPWAPGEGLEGRLRRTAGDEVASAEAAVTVGAGGRGVAKARLAPATPRAWSPAVPDLYEVRAELVREGAVLDRAAIQTGLREVSVRDGAVHLNGRPTLWCGLARHEDWPESGRTATEARVATDLLAVKGLGADFLRTAHYPNHPVTYLVADRLGLQCAEEIPAWQHRPKHFRADAAAGGSLQMWREMCFRDRNRPSLVAWSGANECAGEDPPRARTAYLERLRQDLRTRYDDGRLVMQSAAADSPGAHDASQGTMDVAGWTMYFGIFHGGTYRDGTLRFLRRAREIDGAKPIVATEIGFWASPATEDRFWIFRNPRRKDWRHVHGAWEGRQVEVLRETVGAFESFLREGGPVGGVVWWCAFDWYRHVPGVQTMGLVRMDRRTEKPAAAEMRAAFGRLQAAFEAGRAR